MKDGFFIALAICVLSIVGAQAADPTADITITFTAKQGQPETATLPAAILSNAVHAVSLDLPNALRLVEVSVIRDEEGKQLEGLKVGVLDPGTMLPGAPNISPHPLTLMSTIVKFETDRDIVVFKTSLGDWSVKVTNLAKP
jgi:hypothetical protein